jgi:glycosyltransferase involved in cell wall biosynthesis
MIEMNKSEQKTPLSVIIITKNEGDSILECLKSVIWASEIILLDAGSTDDTVKIAKEFGVKTFICSDWLGFGPQKNRALKLASNEWVLSIDADERISDELAFEIKEIIQLNELDTGFEIPRLSSYCGQFIHHSGWRPDYVLRLFPRKSAKFSSDIVHERVLFNGRTKKLHNSIIHFSYETLDEVLDKANRYSSAGAEMLFNRGKRSSLSKAILHGWWAFLRTYILRRGFLDGKMGFILAISNAETTYYRYLKLMMLNREHHKSTKRT